MFDKCQFKFEKIFLSFASVWIFFFHFPFLLFSTVMESFENFPSSWIFMLSHNCVCTCVAFVCVCLCENTVIMCKCLCKGVSVFVFVSRLFSDKSFSFFFFFFIPLFFVVSEKGEKNEENSCFVIEMRIFLSSWRKFNEEIVLRNF